VFGFHAPSRGRTGPFHVTRSASLDRPLAAGAAIDRYRPESAETLTPLSSAASRCKHLALPDQDRFRQQPVKAEGFRGPRRLPPASGPSRTLCPSTRRRMVERQTPFRSCAVSRPRARPPSPNPAATEVASLGPTLLADFCNQNRARAHRTNDRTPPGTGFHQRQYLGRLPSVGSEQHGPETEVSGRHQSRRRPYWPGSPESACTQRCRGPLEKNPNTPLSPLPSQQTWRVYRAGEAAKAPRQTRRANDCGP